MSRQSVGLDREAVITAAAGGWQWLTAASLATGTPSTANHLPSVRRLSRAGARRSRRTQAVPGMSLLAASACAASQMAAGLRLTRNSSFSR